MLVLDTCTLLWLASGDEALSKNARSIISRNAGRIFVSAISALEIAIKHKSKKLRLPKEPGEWYQLVLQLHGLSEIPVSGEIAIVAAQLPDLHNDPFDRIIIATAGLVNAVVLTPDKEFSKYKVVKTVW